jgi:hypothetical protein
MARAAERGVQPIPSSAGSGKSVTGPELRRSASAAGDPRIGPRISPVRIWTERGASPPRRREDHMSENLLQQFLDYKAII